MAHKELKKKRMLIFFIEAAQEIMKNEGIEAITLRKVADLAGFTSSTLYSYFKDLDHLILFASLKYLKLYNLEVLKQIKKGKSEREKFIIMWKVFCDISFKYPFPYYQIFFNKHSDSLDVISKQYFELFPEELGTKDKNLMELLSETKLGVRNKVFLKRISEEENKSWADIDIMNEMMIALYHYLLSKKINVQNQEPQILYEEKMIEYVNFILKNAD